MVGVIDSQNFAKYRLIPESGAYFLVLSEGSVAIRSIMIILDGGDYIACLFLEC